MNGLNVFHYHPHRRVALVARIAMFAIALIAGLSRIDAAERDNEVHVNATVNRTDALLLDPIELTVTVTAPVDAEIEFPPAAESFRGPRAGRRRRRVSAPAPSDPPTPIR